MDPERPVETGKLLPTLDSLQKRFSCSEKELIIWRNCLFYRYLAIRNDWIKIEANDFDYQDKTLQLPTWITDPIPSVLTKSVIRFYVNDSKRVTITLYFNRQGSGTLLCQGTDCPLWDEKECEVLKHLISDFYGTCDSSSFQNELHQRPVTFLKNFNDPIHFTSPVFVSKKVNIQLTPITSPCEDKSETAETEHDHTMNTVEDNSSVFRVRSFPDTNIAESSQNIIPNISPQSPPEEKTPQWKITPKLAKQIKRIRRRTLYPVRLNEKNVNEKIQSLEKSVEFIMTDQNDMENKLMSLINDAKTSVKNEIKQSMRNKTSDLHDMISDLQNQISKLENTLTTVNNENHSLKAQITALQKEVKHTIKKSHTFCCVSTQCDIENLSKDVPLNEEKGLSPSLNKISIQAQANRETIPETEMDSLEKSHEDSGNIYENTVHQSEVSTNNRFQVLSEKDQITEDYETYAHKVRSSPSSTSYPDWHNANTKNPTPSKNVEQMFHDLDIPETFSTLLVGDSIIRNVDPRRLHSQEGRSYKICIPGLTVGDILQWLKSLSTTHDYIKHLIVHVGVNDCPSGPVSTDVWRDLITLCAKSFPSASIALSSIIPARGRHNLNNAISPSNKNLRTVCASMKVDYIDNPEIFVTVNGAPRLALYRDLIHPSAKGTAKLAQRFQQYLLPAQPPSHPRRPPERIHPVAINQIDSQDFYRPSNTRGAERTLRDNHDHYYRQDEPISDLPLFSSSHFPPLSYRKDRRHLEDNRYQLLPEPYFPNTHQPRETMRDSLPYSRLNEPQIGTNLQTATLHDPMTFQRPHLPSQRYSNLPYRPYDQLPPASSNFFLRGNQSSDAAHNVHQAFPGPTAAASPPTSWYQNEQIPWQTDTLRQCAQKLVNMASNLVTEQRQYY